jgi:broad specificity phosphatase PhoE
MKNLTYLFILIICLSANACDTPETNADSSEVQNITNIFVVRHADRPDGIDTLNQSGIFRARQLADVLRSFKLDAVFSSPYHRTLTTAMPTAQQQDLEIKEYDPRQLDSLAQIVQNDWLGKNVLIVGHSNTVPQTVQAFGLEPDVELIPHDQYDRLYLLQLINKDQKQLIPLHFGAKN